MPLSPTQRSIKALRDDGWLVDIVERWIGGHIKVRKDLFGMFDLIAVRGEEVLLVQTTSGSNVAARVKKIAEHENRGALRKAPMKLVVHGWRKNAQGRWALRVVEV